MLVAVLTSCRDPFSGPLSSPIFTTVINGMISQIPLNTSLIESAGGINFALVQVVSFSFVLIRNYGIGVLINQVTPREGIVNDIFCAPFNIYFSFHNVVFLSTKFMLRTNSAGVALSIMLFQESSSGSCTVSML